MSSGPGTVIREIPAPSRLTVGPEHCGLRAEAFLALALPGLSRTRIRQKVQGGESLLNGRRYATSARMKTGDVLTVFWRSAPIVEAAPRFVVLFEDDVIVALDKPAGVASHPAGRFRSGTVIQFVREQLAADVRASLSREGDFFPSLVNRLDVFTSGVILAAKTRGVLRAMHDLAARGEIGKRYIALVEGRVERTEGRIDLPLGPDPASATSIRMAVMQKGLAAVTDYLVLRRMPRTRSWPSSRGRAASTRSAPTSRQSGTPSGETSSTRMNHCSCATRARGKPTRLFPPGIACMRRRLSSSTRAREPAC